MAATHVTAERLRQLFVYEPDTGRFVRRIAASQFRAGLVAGSMDRRSGYVQMCVDFRNYRAHRLAFLYMTGSIPAEVDHINGDRSDNSWANLRAATTALNAQNRRGRPSGCRQDLPMGVRQSSRNLAKPYFATITISGRRVQLGSFATKEEAGAAFLAAKRAAHPYSTL
jgi:hypothetical protein